MKKITTLALLGAVMSACLLSVNSVSAETNYIDVLAKSKKIDKNLTSEVVFKADSQFQEALWATLNAIKAINFINTQVKPTDSDFVLERVEPYRSLIKVFYSVASDPNTVKNPPAFYVSKDGSFIFPDALDMTPKRAMDLNDLVNGAAANEPATKPAAPAEVKTEAKVDKPDLKIFVMSYCPFGLQMEKAYLPVFNLLNGKANMEVDYVSYIMHGFKEAEQNTRQYCIQKEQLPKFPAYLKCFAETGDHDKCAASAGVDTATLAKCFADTHKQYAISENSTDYPIHKEFNDKYGVQGSPTVILNGSEINVERSPEALKNAICETFKTKPAECSTKLSTLVSTTGIGVDGVASPSSSGGCGQ